MQYNRLRSVAGQDGPGCWTSESARLSLNERPKLVDAPGNNQHGSCGGETSSSSNDCHMFLSTLEERPLGDLDDP